MSWERPSEARLYSLLTLMLLFWSGNYIIAKVALREFPPVLLTCLRTSIAGACMLPIYFSRASGKRETLSWPEFVSLLLLGIFGVIGNQLFFTVGLAFTSVAHASIVVTLMPVLVLFFAAFLGQERITLGKVAGLFIAAAGVAIVQFAKDTGSHATLLGDGFIFLSGISLAMFTVRSKQLMKRYGSLTINGIAYTGGGLVIAPLTAWLSWRYGLGRVSAAAWWSLAYMAVFSSVGAYLIYNYALAHIPASRVAAFSYLQPVVATLLALVFLGEGVTTLLAIGGILVLTGVLITERA